MNAGGGGAFLHPSKKGETGEEKDSGKPQLHGPPFCD
jgi:hypothetical protein